MVERGNVMISFFSKYLSTIKTIFFLSILCFCYFQSVSISKKEEQIRKLIEVNKINIETISVLNDNQRVIGHIYNAIITDKEEIGELRKEIPQRIRKETTDEIFSDWDHSIAPVGAWRLLTHPGHSANNTD